MKRREEITPEFVDVIPDHLEDGVLYISIPYTTILHRCFCGCGAEIVTPLSPTDWELTYDGESVSLSPSIGNWSYPCQSHYWIRHNQVHWARRFSARQIAAVRERDRRAKLGLPERSEESTPAKSEDELTSTTSWLQRTWQRLARRSNS
jgi:hypothetical protein